MLDTLSPLLSALARLCVALGQPFPDLAERMKAHYVSAALHPPDAKPTDSRIAALTGLQRRDVARLRSYQPKPPKPNPQARLVALWLADPAYRGHDALPRSGTAPSFEALAWQVRRDIHPRTLLDTLLAAGTVALDGDQVRLMAASYQPAAGSVEQLDYLARNLGDHLSAAQENVAGTQPPHFERAVHYNGLSADQVAELETAFRDGQIALLQELNEKAAAMKQDGASGRARFRAGGYFYRQGGAE